MTDGQLLAALEAGSIELSMNGATPPAPQPASTHPATPRGNLPSRPTQPDTPPSQPEREASPLQQQQQASPATGMGETAAGQPRTAEQGQPCTARQQQPESAERGPAGSGSASSTAAHGHARTSNQSEEDTPVQKESVEALLGEKIPEGGVVGAAAAQL
jgi:hypothetical protein